MADFKPALRGVFFDLGGTLFSYRGMGGSIAPLLAEACQRLGIELEMRAIGQAFGRANKTVSKLYADKPYYLHSEMFRDTFELFTREMQVDFDEEIYAWFSGAQRTSVIGALELKPDCIDTLAALRSAGMYLSIVSNIDEDMLHPLVERERLDRYLHHWTSSEAAGSCKPHGQFFQVSLQKSGLAPEEVLFVGDSPEHDVQGAHEAGMRTALIVEEGVEPPLQAGKQTVDPDHTITSLSELKALVAGAVHG